MHRSAFAINRSINKKAGAIFFATAIMLMALLLNSAPAQATEGSQPDLRIQSTESYWASYTDYQLKRLGVSVNLRNAGASKAFAVQVTGLTASSGVVVNTALPANVGDIDAGQTVSLQLQYSLPPSVTSFRSYLAASANDAYGNSYSYPAPAPDNGKKIGFSVGDNFASLSDQELENAFADIAGLGVGWLRFDMAWSAAQPNSADSYSWSRFDRIVSAANRYNIKLLPILTYTPRWARRQECIDTFKCAPADPAAFATYAAAAAARYSSMGIHTWEIWNEPNLGLFWKPSPDAAAYTDLLERSYTSIKAVDSQATVIGAGLSDPAGSSGGNIDPRVFLNTMYQNGAKDYMDAVGYHPYSFPNLPSTTLDWSGWSIMGDVSYSIRSVMTSNGDGNKQIWATEFGCPTDGPTWRGDETVQAQIVRDGIQQMDAKPWLASLFLYSYKDLGTDPDTMENFFGLIRFDGSRKPAYFELQDVLAER